MKKISISHIIVGLILMVAVTSLLPGVPGVPQMAADIHAGWLFDQARKQLRQDPPAWAAAETTLKKALACHPRAPQFRDRVVGDLVNVLRSQKKWLECAALLEVSLTQKISPEKQLRLILATCYDNLEDYPRAEKIYTENLERYPDDPGTNNDFAYHYAQRGIRLDRALEMAKRALAQNPNEGAYIDTLGWIYFRKGWLRQAEIELLRAVQLIPLEGRAEVLYHLGVLYAEQGRHELATQFLSQALKLQPDFPEASALLKKEQRRSDFQGKVNV